MSGPALVRWIAKGQHGEVAAWAGNGTGIAKMFDEQHNGGAAVLVEFNVPNRLQAWIPPEELQQIDPEAS